MENGREGNCQTVIMSYQLKLNGPICKYPRLTNLSRHLTTVHGINGQERKCLLAKAHFSGLSMQPDQPQPSIPDVDSTLVQFGNSLPKTSSLPEQNKLPNPAPYNSTSDENEDELIPCPYDSRTSYERIWSINVDLMRTVLLIFGTCSICFILGSYIFHGLNTLRKI